MIWFLFIYTVYEFTINTVRATPQEIYSAQILFGYKSEEQENAPSALISISKPSTVLKNQCDTQLGWYSAVLLLGASGVRKNK